MNMKKIDLVVLICALFVGGIAYIVNAEMNVVHINSNPTGIYSEVYGRPAAATTAPFSIGSTNTDYSNAIDISGFESFSVQTKCTSTAGGVDYKLETETSNWVSQTRFSPDETLWSTYTTEDWTAVTDIYPSVANFLRLRFTGVGSNSHDTGCWAEINMYRGQ